MPQLTSHDLRYARPIDLERLTGVDAANWSAWTTKRSLTDRTISTLAQRLNLTPSEFLAGWMLRRQDAASATATAEKINQILQQRHNAA